MCYVKPLRIKKITGKKAVMENGIQAIIANNLGKIKVGDQVTVFGNLIIDRVKPDTKL